MKANKRTPTWPYLGMLTCLFALTVTAPRAWERMASRAAGVQAVQPDATRDDAAREMATLTPTVALASSTTAPADEPAATASEREADGSSSSSGALPSADELLAILAAAANVEAPRDAAPIDPLFVAPPPIFASEYTGPPGENLALKPAPRDPLGRLLDPAANAVAPRAVSARPALALWPNPAALHSQLTALRERGIAVDWCTQVQDRFNDLCQLAESDGRESRSTLAALSELADEADQIAAGLGDAAGRAELDRVVAATKRRLAIWTPVSAADAVRSRPAEATRVARDKLMASLDKIESLTGAHQEGESWRSFIRFEELREIVRVDDLSADAARSLSQMVIERLDNASRSTKYRQFLTNGPFDELTRALGPLASQPVAASELLDNLERYESTKLSSDAEPIAQKIRWLSWSEDPESRELSRRLRDQYLRPNVRIAVTEPMINRIVRQQNVKRERVHDNILGADVHGYSVSLTNVHVKLIPDASHVRLGLEADGTVSSNTNARTGPAQLRSEGRSRFSARKVFVFGPRGLETLPSEAEANNYGDQLLSVNTDFDGLPLFGPLARKVAQTQHEDSRDSVRRIIERKVANRAKSQLDREVQARIQRLQTTLEQRVVESLDRLAIQPEPVEFETTPERVTMQWRLSSHDQLSAHTPRPWAPKDSQLSVQIHQTAVNNALDRLDLNGRSLTAPEVYRWIANKLGKSEPMLPDDLPEDAVIVFAQKDALRVHCEDDRIELTISLAELRQGKRRWRNFSAQAFFRPEIDELQVRLVRDTAIYLGGESLRGKPQVVLRGIFSKLMPRDRVWELLPSQWSGDERLKGLELTQLAIVDGWIGLAIGPTRIPLTARREAGPKQE